MSCHSSCWHSSCQQQPFSAVVGVHPANNFRGTSHWALSELANKKPKPLFQRIIFNILASEWLFQKWLQGPGGQRDIGPVAVGKTERSLHPFTLCRLYATGLSSLPQLFLTCLTSCSKTTVVQGWYHFDALQNLLMFHLRSLFNKHLLKMDL